MSVAKKFVNALKASQKKTKPADDDAVVQRVEGGTAWVHIPGGVDETPVQMTINCRVGETVKVRRAGGRAWVVGNGSAPPTDDKRAKQAEKKAIEAAKTASFITETANGVFVHPADDNKSGWKIDDVVELLKNGVSYIWAGIVNAVPTIRIGREDSGHTSINSNGMRVYGGDGTNQLAHIGYDYGNPEGGGSQTKAPYFSLGRRKTGSAIGNYSYSEGGANVASGYISHAEGKNTEAIGDISHAEGLQTVAYANETHAAGWGTYADQDCQTVVGRWNKKKPSGQTYEDSLFAVGCGLSDSNRATAFEVKQNPLGISPDDELPKLEVNGKPLFKLIKAHNLETSPMPADSFTANDVKHDITSLVPDGYEILNITVSGTGYNCVNVYRLTWGWENNKLYVLYRLRNFGDSQVSATPYVNIVLINKGLL